MQRAGNKIPNYRETQNYVTTVLQLYAYLKPSAGRRAAAAGRRPHSHGTGGARGRRARTWNDA